MVTIAVGFEQKMWVYNKDWGQKISGRMGKDRVQISWFKATNKMLIEVENLPWALVGIGWHKHSRGTYTKNTNMFLGTWDRIWHDFQCVPFYR